MTPLARQLNPISTGKLRACIQDLYSRFMRLRDCRSCQVEYPIEYLFTVLAMGLMLGDNTVKAIESTLTTNAENVFFFLGKDRYYGCPSDTTLLRELWATCPLDVNLAVSEWSMQWFGGEERAYSIDGKANRAARRQVDGRTHCPYILNAFATVGKYIAAQIKIDDKKSELSVLRGLFKMLPMEGAFFTADAFATYDFVLREARAAGAHCLLPLKENQQKLCELATNHIRSAIENTPNLVRWYEDEDNGKRQHGREEFRSTAIITEGVPELVKGTKFEGLVEGIGIISRDRNVIRHGDAEDIKSNQTLVYLYTKKDMTAQEVANYARGHWAGCEMIHYVLDTEFAEDGSTIRKDHGMENMSCLRKCAYSLLLWVMSMVSVESFHSTRTMLRDLNGIPEVNDVEYRRMVRQSMKEKRTRKKRRSPSEGKTASGAG